MTIELTKEEARELIDRAVKEKGSEYVYDKYTVGAGGSCSYFDDKGAPSCIVGHVLAYKGLKRDDLRLTFMNDLNTGAGIDGLVDHGIVQTEADVLNALAEAQCAQDSGQTWGQARGAFEDFLDPEEEG